MTERKQSEYEYLRGKAPTERQIRHLQEDLHYRGSDPMDAYEASQLIEALHADPAVQSRQLYENRIREGPNWLIWEKWMFSSRREYDKQQWQSWWDETRKLGHEAGMTSVPIPPAPLEWRRSIYSTADDLLCEIRKVLGVPNGTAIQLEVSVGSMEEAIQAKEKLANMREDLRIIDEDASWMLARIRESVLGDSLIGKLFEENAGGTWRGVHLQRDQFRIMKKELVKSYTYVRGVTMSLKTQIREFMKRVNEVYKK